MRHLRSVLSIVGATLLLPFLAGSASADEPAQVPQLNTFRDWVIGCDNIRRCTAVGLTGGSFEGYIVVKREGAAEAEPQVTLSVAADKDIALPAMMSVAVDGEAVPGMSLTQWPVVLPYESQKRYGQVKLTGRDSALLVQQLHEGKVLTLSVTGQGQDRFDTPISLAGATAALLYADDAQKRTGTVTALVEPGKEPASRVPAPPPIPYLNAVVMKEVEHPPAKLPHGVKKPPADDCQDPPPPDVIRLSPTLELWGVCEFKNSHNFSTRYWLVGDGQVREASMTVPGHPDDGGSPSVIINLSLSRDGRLLHSFVKGRGLGDCGSDTYWIWNGSAFELAQYAEMSECAGVSADDWPVLYTTRLK